MTHLTPSLCAVHSLRSGSSRRDHDRSRDGGGGRDRDLHKSGSSRKDRDDHRRDDRDRDRDDRRRDSLKDKDGASKRGSGREAKRVDSKRDDSKKDGRRGDQKDLLKKQDSSRKTSAKESSKKVCHVPATLLSSGASLSNAAEAEQHACVPWIRFLSLCRPVGQAPLQVSTLTYLCTGNKHSLCWPPVHVHVLHS